MVKKFSPSFWGKTIILFLAVFLVWMVGLKNREEVAEKTPVMTEQKIEFFAMDTYMTFTVLSLPEQSDAAKTALEKAREEIFRLESLLSATLPESDIGRFNASTDEGALMELESIQVLSKSLELCEKTEGALNIALLPVSQAWGWGRRSSSLSGENQPRSRIPEKEALRDLLSYSRWEDVIVLPGKQMVLRNPENLRVQVDLGAIAKGYAAGRMITMLHQEKIPGGICSLGGTVCAFGNKADGSDWRIAIENPNGGEPAGILTLTGQVVATSGGYQRYFEEDGKRYHHILNPETGYPAENDLASVTVSSPNGLLADGLSTALFVMGLEKASLYWKQYGIQRGANEFEAVFLTKDGKAYCTEGLSDRFVPGAQFEKQVIAANESQDQ